MGITPKEHRSRWSDYRWPISGITGGLEHANGRKKGASVDLWNMVGWAQNGDTFCPGGVPKPQATGDQR